MITRSFPKSLLISTGIICVLAITYGAWTYAGVRAEARRDEAAPADAIVVMGAAQYNGRPSPVLRARLEHARYLFEHGYANIIVTTGSYGPDPNFSEAEVGTRYLAGLGIDPSQIMTEQGSGSTYDTVLAVSRLMHSHGWSEAIIVSDGFHLYRLKRMFESNSILALTSPAPDSVIESSRANRIWFSLREVGLVSLYRMEQLLGVDASGSRSGPPDASADPDLLDTVN